MKNIPMKYLLSGVLALSVHIVKTYGQCLIAPVQGTAYEVNSCGPYRMQALTGNLAPAYGACGNLSFTSPLTGSDISTSIAEAPLVNGPDVYPNPTENSITIHLEQNGGAIAELYSPLGHRLVFQQLTGEFTQWDLQPYPAGYYFLRITTGEHIVFTFKLIKN